MEKTFQLGNKLLQKLEVYKQRIAEQKTQNEKKRASNMTHKKPMLVAPEVQTSNNNQQHGGSPSKNIRFS